MTRAYNKMYLEPAQQAMAVMLDYVVNQLNYNIDDFFALFIKSGIAECFQYGVPKYVAGRSGFELVYDTFFQLGMECDNLPKPIYSLERSPEYWAGWALAYYQWESRKSFAEILNKVTLEEIRNMYWPYHEMDLRQFRDRMNELTNAPSPSAKTMNSDDGIA